MSTVIGTAIIDIKANTTKLTTGMEKAQRTFQKTTENMKRDLKRLATAYLGFKGVELLTRGVEDFIKTGFEFNRNIENAKAGLTALAVATSSNTSAFGKHLTIMQKYNLAGMEATKTIQALVAINAQTPHTLNQTILIYKSMYASMKNAGASTKDMIELTKRLSIAAGVGGVQFKQLLAGVDGLATGTVLVNSDLGRFLSALGITNKALKNSSNVVELLKSKLKDFKAVDTIDVAISNLSNAWSQLTGGVTKNSFGGVKKDIKELTRFLNTNRDGIEIWIADIARAFVLLGTRIADTVVTVKLVATKLALANAKVANFVTFGMSTKTKKNIEAYKNEIKILEIQDKLLVKDYQKTLSEYGKITKEHIKETLDSLTPNKATLKVWSDYYKGIGNLQNAWLTSEQRVKAFENATALGLKGTNFDSYISRYKSEFLKPLEKQTKATVKKIDSYNIGRYLSNPLADIRDINAKDKRINDAKATYYEATGQYTSAWEIKSADLRAKYMGLLTTPEIDELIAKYKSDYFKPMKDMGKDTATYMQDIFKTMSDSLTSSFGGFFDYTSKGFMNFGDLANSVLHDVYMQIMKVSVINPMVSGIMGGITSLFTPMNVAPNLALSMKGYAKGDVFTPFANGGAFTNSIVTEPTPFAYGGSFGVMGEAGAEAIMPLTRHSNGELGVKSTPSNVIINIENKSGTPVDMKQVSEFMNDDGTKTIGIVMNAIERNPDFRQAIKGIR